MTLLKWWRKRLLRKAVAARPLVRKCRVEEDDEQGGTYFCTLRWGHGGKNHETWISGRCVHRWERWPWERRNDSPR